MGRKIRSLSLVRASLCRLPEDDEPPTEDLA